MFLTELLNYDVSSKDRPQWLADIFQECQDFDNIYYLPEHINNIVSDLKGNLYGYIKVGVLADLVRGKNLWENIAGSFNEFCLRILGKSRWWFDRVINASKVALNLINNGFDILPMNEAQARPLTSLDCLDQIRVWQNITNSIPQEKITARAIEKFVTLHINKMNEDPDVNDGYYTAPKPKQKVIKVKQSSWDKLEEKARKYGLNPKDYLDALLDKELGAEPDDEEIELEDPIESETTTDKQNLIESDPQVKTDTQLVKTLPPLKTEKSLEEFFTLIAQVFVSWNSGRLKT